MTPRLSILWPAMLGFGTLAALVAILGLWGVMARLDGAVIAPARFISSDPPIILQHPDGGRIASLNLREGDRVRAGQTLLTLTPEKLATERAILEHQFHEILARSARLRAEQQGETTLHFPPALRQAMTHPGPARDLAQGQITLARARRETQAQELAQLRQRQTQAQRHIQALEDQGRSLTQEIALLQGEFDAQSQLLARGLTQSARVNGLKRDLLRLNATKAEIRAAIARAQGQITEIDLEILRTKAQRRQEAITQLRDLGFRQLEIEQRLAAIHAQQSRLTITAPIDGTIHALAPLSQGGVLRATEPILTLIPAGLPTTLTAQIQAADIPHIHRGQSVRIRLTTIHDASVLMGTVAMISGDRYRAGISGDRYREATRYNTPGTYQVRIRLTQDTAIQDLRDILIVGLPAEAHFKTQSRSPISYLTHPFGDLLARALRTP